MADKHSHEIAKSQIEVNKEEAMSAFWITGWSLLGWICTLAIIIASFNHSSYFF